MHKLELWPPMFVVASGMGFEGIEVTWNDIRGIHKEHLFNP